MTRPIGMLADGEVSVLRRIDSFLVAHGVDEVDLRALAWRKTAYMALAALTVLNLALFAMIVANVAGS